MTSDSKEYFAELVVIDEGCKFIGHRLESCLVIMPDKDGHIENCHFISCTAINRDGTLYVHEALGGPQILMAGLPAEYAALLGPQARALGAMKYRADLTFKGVIVR